KSPRDGKRVLSSISRFLCHRLKLVVNTTKSHVVKTSESKFLGIHIQERTYSMAPEDFAEV
ncbi:MAG: RNA-directed DNA polymerase, partial [Pseudohongiellaceae bacterium]